MPSELKATPIKHPLAEQIARYIQAADEFGRKPFGYPNPPVAMLSDFAGIPGIYKTLDRIAYDEPLTTGRGMTTRIHPDVEEGTLAATQFIQPTGALAKLAERGVMKAGRAGERLAERARCRA